MEYQTIPTAEREKSCLFTGHRSLGGVSVDILSQRIAQAILEMYGKGVRTFYAGGATGFDMIASATLLNLKAEKKDLRLILALPHFRHYARWGRADKALFAEILKRADEVVYIEKAYTHGCMQRRNRYMVDRAAYCICYLTKNEGGSAFTVREARRQGLKVVNTAQETAEQLSLL